MKKWNYCNSLVLLACLSFSMEMQASDVNSAKVLSVDAVVQARDVILKGKVTDKEGNELPGASILVEGTTVGTVTDINGNYSLRFVPKSNQALIFSFVGFKTKKIAYDGKPILNVILDSGDISLDDVVVIGYGSKNRKSVTSSVSSMDKKEMERLSAVSSSVDNLLIGTIKGVQTTQTSGEPGKGVSINVRGITSPYPNLLSGQDSNVPLYVIDGVPMFISSTSNLNPLLNIAPADIESIDVLKDAAATAIYGSRGANGVIIVNTKTGRKGEKVSVEANYTLSIGNPTKQYDPLTTAEFKDFQDKILRRSETGFNEGWLITDPDFLSNYGKFDLDEDTYMITYKGLDNSKYGTANTNWIKEIQNKNAISHQYSLAIRGGSEKTNYSFSFNGLNQEGTYINDNLERYSARMAMDTEITKWLKFGSILNYSYSSRKSGLSGVESYMPMDGPWMVRPDVAVYDADGNYNRIDISGVTMGLEGGDSKVYMANPVQEKMKRKTQYINNQFLGNAYMDINVLKGLKLHADVNLARYTYTASAFDPKSIGQERVYFGQESWGESTLQKSNSIYTTASINFRADYNLNIGNHNFSAMFGYGTDRSWDEYESFVYKGFPNDEVLDNQGSANQVTSHSDSYLRNGLNSVYGRVTYDYASRYLFEASLRGDASSKFGPDNKWGVFPAVSLGWRINNENFLKKVRHIDDLKLRFSWGKTGSTNIPDFAYKQFYIGGASYGPGNGIGLKDMLPNKEIRWEMTSEYNVGLDWSFFNNRLTGSLDVYYRSTDGALAPAPYILESGFTTYYANIIDTSNKGVEVNIGGDIIRTKDFTWNSNFNIATNKSKLKSLNGANVSSYIQDIFVEGEAIGTSKGYKVAGIFQTQEEIDELNAAAIAKDPVKYHYYQNGAVPGDYKIEDINGDGVITSDDKVIIIRPEAKCFGGWSNVLTYKDLSLAFLFQFRCGGEAMYDNLSMAPMTYVGNSILREYYEDMWSPENPNGRYPHIVAGYSLGGLYNSNNDRYVFKTSYLRLKNITLSYTLPNIPMKKLGVQNASVFVSATNLFTVSQWPGLDPEMVGTGTSTMGSSTDAYPMCRTFSMGFKVQF